MDEHPAESAALGLAIRCANELHVYRRDLPAGGSCRATAAALSCYGNSLDAAAPLQQGKRHCLDKRESDTRKNLRLKSFITAE